jgi:hypothetical protein
LLCLLHILIHLLSRSRQLAFSPLTSSWRNESSVFLDTFANCEKWLLVSCRLPARLPARPPAYPPACLPVRPPVRMEQLGSH